MTSQTRCVFCEKPARHNKQGKLIAHPNKFNSPCIGKDTIGEPVPAQPSQSSK